MQKLFFSTFLFIQVAACAQSRSGEITVTETTRIVSILAADSMQGRKAGTAGSDKAAHFIAAEFKKAGLQPLYGDTFLQSFKMIQPRGTSISTTINGLAVGAERVLALTIRPHLKVNETSGYTITQIEKGENLYARASDILEQRGNNIVFIDSSFADRFPNLAGFQQPVFEAEQEAAASVNTIFVLGAATPQTFAFDVQQTVDTLTLHNVVGILPGTSKKEEQVIFSAHYDHIGIGQPQNGDSIYNGANDDASGTTAVIQLAQYFSKQQANARTLVFAAFTAEESGGFGSQYFSVQVPPENVMAMFNIEMIGTESKWGRNSAFITGFDKTNMGAILQKNLTGSKFRFYPDPYPQQQLFYRSDNATLARLGVPAHTISTSKMDNEPNYHKTSDEVKTLDLPNMAEIIKAIALSSQSIIAGKATPTRVSNESLK
jgi:hypothetical protein